MARKPNYQVERMERDRAKAAKLAGKQAAKKAEREEQASPEHPGDAPSEPER